RSCAAKLCTMNTVPIGNMMAARAFIDPVVAAASGSCPSGATKSASVKPTMAWVARVITIGHASRSSARRFARGAATDAAVRLGDSERGRSKDRGLWSSGAQWVGVPPHERAPNPVGGTARRSDLEQARCAHPAADAHRDDPQAAPAPPQLVEQRGGQLRAGAAERVAERDGATVHVELLVRDAKLPLDVHRLGRE